jgi:protoheme IX farnesyltransferase
MLKNIRVKCILTIHFSSWKEWAILLLSLGKIRISLPVTLTAAAGYLLATGQAGPPMLLPTVAVFLLASGSCSLNQYHERAIDASMERTRSRVLPTKRLPPKAALMISLAEMSSGSLLLLFAVNPLSFLLGLFAVFWYNGVYTRLKQRTAFAVIPGALIGAIPPAIGWVSGGGDLLDPRMRGIALFFFMWQAPHFWLLLLDFGKEYEAAGLPSVTRVFSTKQLKRILFIWLLSTGVSCLLIPVFGVGASVPVRILLMGLTLWFFWIAIAFFKSSSHAFFFRLAFIRLNIYVFFVIALLSLDRFLFFSYTRTGLITRMLASIGFKPV